MAHSNLQLAVIACEFGALCGVGVARRGVWMAVWLCGGLLVVGASLGWDPC